MSGTGSPLGSLFWIAGIGGATYWWLSRPTVSRESRAKATAPTPGMDPEFKRIASEVARALKDRKLPRLKGAVSTPFGLAFVFGPDFHHGKNWDDDAVDAAIEAVLATHRWFRYDRERPDLFRRDGVVVRFYVSEGSSRPGSRVLYGKGMPSKPRKGARATRGSTAMLTGFDFFDVPDVPARTTRANAFRDSRVGYVFHASGRDWKVINAPGDKPGDRIIQGHPPRMIRGKVGLEHEPALYASLDGETLVVHALAKRGPFAPVGKALWREDMSDEA